MKNIILLFSVLICGFLKAQTLTVPTDYITSTSAVRDTFINWTIRSEIISTSTLNGTSEYNITNSFDPENSDLNTMESAGGNTSGWALYWTTPPNDSSFFTDTVSVLMGDNIEKIQGRNTIARKTWGEYFNDNHVIYWQPSQSRYLILAAKINGTFLSLSDVVTIKNQFSGLSAYKTSFNVGEINPASLEVRSTW